MTDSTNVLAETELSKLYQIRFDTHELARKNAIWKVLCDDFFQQYIGLEHELLDVACGYGEFSNNIKAGLKTAIDLNPDAPYFLESDIEFISISASEISSVGIDRFDRVFTSNFLEHLSDKKMLDEVLEEILKSLKPGGKFLIMGPNLRYLPGEYWDFYDHHLGLTHLSLQEALQLKGFHIEKCVDKFLPFSTQSILPTNPFLVKIYLKLPFAWRIFGKQFFIMARKPNPY